MQQIKNGLKCQKLGNLNKFLESSLSQYIVIKKLEFLHCHSRPDP